MGILELWLPIVLSAVAVFVVSSILHMMLKFWHQADYNGFSNEDEVRRAVNAGNPKPGIYSLPYCEMANMGNPEVQERMKEGPMAILFVQKPGLPNMVKSLGQWIAYCLLVSLFAAYVATIALAPGSAGMQVFQLVSVVTFMAYSLGTLQYGIWWGQPWKAVFKDVIDGLIFGLLTGAIFAWLWPGMTG